MRRDDVRFEEEAATALGSRRRSRLRGRAVAIAVAAAGAAALLPGAASAAVCGSATPFALDSGGYRWDVAHAPPVLAVGDQKFATLGDGGSNGPADTPPGPRSAIDSYDGFGALYVGGEAQPNLYYSGDNNSCSLEDGGRELAFPVLRVGGLDVQRKLYVSPTGLPGARILNLVRNSGAAPVTTSVQVGELGLVGVVGGLGSNDDTAVRYSSNGDAVATAADYWAVTSDSATTNKDLALAHVFDGPGGRDRIDFATVADPNPSIDRNRLAYRWENVTIRPGETAAYLSYEIQQGVPGANAAQENQSARRQALAYQANPLGHIYRGMSDPEIAAVRNWAKPRPTAAIADPGTATDAAPVTLASTGSTATSVPGRCEAAAYAWDFGDGASGRGPRVSHRYSPGRYDVRLTVTNSCGETATATRTLQVTDAAGGVEPKAGVELARKASLRQLLRGLRMTLTANEQATASIVGSIPARLARKAGAARKIFATRASVTAESPKVVRLKPSRKARAGLERIRRTARRLTLTVKVSMRTATGRVETTTRRVSIRLR